MNWRKKLIFLYDYLSMGKINQYYQDLDNYYSTFSLEQRKEYNKIKLQEILSYCNKNVPYYSSSNSNEISEFPIVDKVTIKINHKNFISKLMHESDLIKTVTSGSTGTPFMVYHNKDKKDRNVADTMYFSKLSGYEFGEKLIYLKIWVKKKMSNRVHYFFRNFYPVDVIKLNDKQIEEILYKITTSVKKISILGYASALEEICKYLDRKNNLFHIDNVDSIIAMSESLNEYTKIRTKKYFGKMAISRYSNLENGIMAQQFAVNDTRYLINSASYFVEVLKLDSDESSVEGELGRIIITDLFNKAMPIVRYDTGDLGSIEVDSSTGLKYLTKIEGRKLDAIFDSKGNHVSSYIVYKNMWQYTNINQYQLVQVGKKDFVFKINIDGIFKDEVKLVSEFKEYLGNDSSINIEYVNEIPLLSSGKRKKIVNLYNMRGDNNV